jgi:hypothetical protein
MQPTKEGIMTTPKRVTSAMLATLAATAGIYLTTELNSVYAAQSTPPVPKVGDAVGEAQFAWLLFVQAVRPSGNAQAPLTFETWKEQCEIQPLLCGNGAATDVAPKTSDSAKTATKGRVRRAHGSALGRRLMQGNRGDSTVACSPMNTQGFPGIPATNVAENAVFCEEVFVNPAESTFIEQNKLTTLSGQEAFGNVTFPWSALEVKVDWVPQSSFKKPFSCTEPTLYIEKITFEGQPQQCYAMVGLHVSSKALPDWVWATFEPNYPGTNPNRCNGQLYDLCFDPWGTTSSTPYGPGQTPKQSPALANLMTSAKLPAAFKNYYLTGVQTQFVKNGQPTQLGNSFVEFNAGVEPHQASCITCHKYAYAGTTNIGFPLNGWPNIGYACNATGATANCLPPTGNKWTSEDFSWLLGIMPSDASGSAPKASSKHPAAKATPKR